jgi:hypothetical protein|tara:strand:- start:28666 stop:29010 length:345 start_codon:yes stop_codon:yes gene_type:complete
MFQSQLVRHARSQCRTLTVPEQENSMRPRQLSLPLTQDSTSYPLFCAFFAGESFLPKCWRQDFYCTKWVGACSLVFKASEDQDRLSLDILTFCFLISKANFQKKWFQFWLKGIC